MNICVPRNTGIWLQLQAPHMHMRYVYAFSFLILHKGTDLIFMILSFEVHYRQILIIIVPDRKVLFSVVGSENGFILDSFCWRNDMHILN